MSFVTRQSPEPMQDDVYYQRMREVLLAEPCRGYPTEPSHLLNHMYIGSQSNAENLRLLRKLGVTHVLNCAGYKGHRPKPNASPYEGLGIDYCEFKAEDHESYDITKHFYEAFNYLNKTEREGGVCLVHCALGVNRSAAVCLAYMMVRNTISLLRATKIIKEKRRVVLANRGFQRQLVRFARMRGLLDRHVIPDGRESPARRSSIDYSSQRRPSIEYSSSSTPAIAYITQRRPSVEYSSQRRPSIEYSSHRPSIEYSSQRRPSIEYSSQRRPSIEYTSHRTPSIDYSTTRPAIEYHSQRRSSVDYGSPRRPSVDYISQRKPSVEYSNPRRASMDYRHVTSVRAQDYLARPAIRYRSSSVGRPIVHVREPLLVHSKNAIADRLNPRLLPLPPARTRHSVTRDRTF